MPKPVSPCHPGTHVKEKVIPKGVSIKKAAEMIGIGRPALSNFLNKKARLSMNMAIRLEKAFGAKKEDLLALQQEYDSFTSREDGKRIAVKGYAPSFLKITATHIETWADKIKARSLLPVLLRRLVNTTGGEIAKSNFPAYDKSQTQGWDGEVESNNVTPWIPSGLSGWEFGCNKVPKTKADGDYKARVKSIPEPERKQITFVFVTPRSWPQKDDWVKAARERKEWKNVVAFDASDIEQWLELSVSVQVWLAEQLGLPTSECQSLNSYWLFWSQAAAPAISPRIFSSAISDYSKKIKEWYLATPDKPFILTAASKEEAKAFLCCIAEQVDELQPLLDQAIFVSSSATVKRLSEISTDFIPIVDTEEAQKELVGSFKNSHSIIISERNITGLDPDIYIDLPSVESFKEALEDMGFDEAQVDVYANQSGQSPTILRRQLAEAPALRKPEWATSTKMIRTMIPMVLAGSWSTVQEADREILSYLAGKDYPQIEKDIAELASIDDSPIWSEGKYRGVVSELECIYAISNQLTDEDVNNFFDLAVYILSEDDPSLDLEKEKRWAANIYDKVRNHSSAIRRSICQNLIILAVHGNSLLNQRLGIDTKSKASALVRTLLQGKDPRSWQAQQGNFPEYAEAAPDMFLSIVEEELQKGVPAFKILFEPTESGMFSRCERTGMLWALELLAWTPSLLARVVTILGKLSMYNLDDNWTNKPINSIKDILLAWKPHTAASLEQRCEVLELLCSLYPEVGWEMCTQPLRQRSSSTSGTYRPRWRSDASGAGNTVTYGEKETYELKCLELVISWPLHSVKTLKGLVDCLPSMREDDQNNVVKQVKEWIKSSPNGEEVIDLREYVRTRTMTGSALRRNKKRNNNIHGCGKELYKLLDPKDLLLKHLWLFARGWVDYSPEELGEDNFDPNTREKELAKQRVNALSEIVDTLGIQGVIDLIKKSGSGFQIGAHLHNTILTKSEIPEFITVCLSFDEDQHCEFGNSIAGVFSQMEENERKLLISNLVNQLNIEPDNQDMVSRIFIHSSFCRSTWDHLERHSDEIINTYWLQVHPDWTNLPSEDLRYAFDKLLERERPFAAFNLARFKLKMLESMSIVRLLNAIPDNVSKCDISYKPSQSDIEELLKALNDRDDLDHIELVKLEYLYVDILHSHSSYGIPNLAKEVSEAPLSFMQLMAYSYKRSGGGSDPVEWNIPQNKEEKEIVAMKAYHILDSVNIIPGTKKDGSINVGKLREWILQVRQLAKEHGRGDIADQKIGKLLSTSPTGDDGIWPREEIREVFEEIGSTQISIGMEIGLYNSGGAEFRSRDSSRERSTAEKYSEMATQVMNKTPFVGQMLNNMAKKYTRDAEWWDTDHRVNKRLRGW